MVAVLYSFRRCPYAMRARMALHISALKFEHREVILRDKPAAMIKASPKATVPVLVLNEGHVIDESLDVMQWALSQHDPLGWLKCDLETVNTLIETNDGPFKYHLDRYKYASRYQDGASYTDKDLVHRQNAEPYLQVLEKRLSHGPYLLGADQSLADIAIFPFIRQFANTDILWWETTSFTKLREWLTRHIESELFKAIMVKHPVWKSDP